MKLYKLFFTVVLISCVVFLFKIIHTCNAPKLVQREEIQIPGHESSFEPVYRDSIVHVPVYIPVDVPAQNNEEAFLKQLLSENASLLEHFQQLNDSLQLQLFSQAIQINTFERSFEDDRIKIDFSGVVRGEVQSVQSSYFIKPQIFTAEIPKSRVLKVGIENDWWHDVPLRAGFMYENRAGHTFKISSNLNREVLFGLYVPLIRF